ncbi:retention module-containing protein, partial [Polaromonas eurypsychrophila]|uniref:retention module-containing protein n=1 Tax=Polaromonas eurypsychrophila TaxID=1614635 RepID=UPI001667FB73
MANETKVVGNVVVIEGVAFAQNKEGVQRQLQFGDPVFEGEVLVTATGGRVELVFDQGGKFLLRSKETVTLDSTVFDNLLPDGNSGALLPRIGELTNIINAISEGSSLDRLLQETSSGVGSASSVSGNNIRPDDGNSFVRLIRIAEALAPLTYEYTSLERHSVEYSPTGGGRSTNTAGVPDIGDEIVVQRTSRKDFLELVSTLSPVSTPATTPTTTTTTTTVTLSSATAGASITEGGSITYIATVGAPVTGSDLVVGLSNGQTITIPVGQSSATALYTVRADNLYGNGNEALSVTIGGISGGSFEAVAAIGTVANIVVDDVDTATLSLMGSESVTEGGTASYTVSLTSPAQMTAVMVNLAYSGTAADGSDFTGVVTVAIAIGSSSASFDITAIDDFLAEGAENITVTVVSVVGGDFESLVVGSASSVTTTLLNNNHTPVISSAVQSGSVEEDGALTAS